MNVLKWCLNRPQQAKNFNDLIFFAGLNQKSNIYKPLRDSEIKKSEKIVSDIINVMENEYLNPFSPLLEEDKLYNLSSGCCKEEGVDELLNIYEAGKVMANEFLTNRILSSREKFHEPIRKKKIPTFFTPKIKVSTAKSESVIEANRNIIGKLLSIGAKTEQLIDFQKALNFSLYTVPLCLAYPDGTRRASPKSKLLEVILMTPCLITELPSDIIRHQFVFIVDMMSQVRSCMTSLPDSYEEFILNFLRTLPKGFHRVDIVADCYRNNSIKSSERIKRGDSEKVIIGSLFSRLPRDMNKFLMNNDNKNSLIKLIFRFIRDNRARVLQMLQTETIILSGDSECYNVTATSVSESTLKSNHEEADTKVVMHVYDILQNTSLSIVLRSPSGDTDILVILLGVITSGKERVYYDYGNGKNRKGTWLHAVQLEDDQQSALIGFHAFTGNDYVSSFLRKGKKMCWKVMMKNEDFIKSFSDLGHDWTLNNEIVCNFEKYVCELFNSKARSVNACRFEMFRRKYTKENKAIDLSLLPPCSSSLILHLKRSNFVAAMWKRTPSPILELPNITDHGWNIDGTIEWITQSFPDSIEELLIQHENDDFDLDFDNDVDTDCEDDML